MNHNLRDLIIKYDKQVPRYTSYPTAPNFLSAIDSNLYINWLKKIPEGSSISLYFHIPFCSKLCWYCGCHTKITRKYNPIKDYIYFLMKEIRMFGKLLEKKHLVSHIHFGGGSPTILYEDDFLELMSVVRDEFLISKSSEIAIEIDPRTVNELKISAYKKAGVNRASIGVQDFNKEVQEAVNRRQSFSKVYDTVNLLREYNINQISMDLLYGLPKQNLETTKQNIDCTLSFNPDRIALFGYAHVPWKKKHMRQIDESSLPNASERLQMFEMISESFTEKGYINIGLDHFVKPNDDMFKAYNEKKLRRNFQGYTTDNAQALIGFGLSAISSLPQGYIQNTADKRKYESNISSSQLPIVKGSEINQEDKLRKKIIETLMCYMEVDVPAICSEYSFPDNFFDDQLRMLEPLAKDGLVQLKDGKIFINQNARQLVKLVCSFFDAYYISGEQKYSKLV